jgi:hypothetical protein
MKSIEFSAPMMRALLRNEKTMTRRRMKPQPENVGKLWRWKDTAWCDGRALVSDKAPIDYARYKQGDLVWVKEPLARAERYFSGVEPWPFAAYLSDGELVMVPTSCSENMPQRGRKLWQWKRSALPARFCPREASRATVRITGVRIERLQDITIDDAIREGVKYMGATWKADPIGTFRLYWDQLHGNGAWDHNDWIWVYGFEVTQ